MSQQPPQQSQKSSVWNYRWNDTPPPQPPAYPVQQQPMYQQPVYQQPMYYQPFAQPSTQQKSNRLPWIIALIIVFFVGIAIGRLLTPAASSPDLTSASTPDTGAPASTQATSAPTQAPTPTQPPKWTTVQTFSGNGIKKTAIFAVPDDWKIAWSCQGDDIGGMQSDGVLSVTVYNSDNTMADPAAVNATCKAGQTTSDSTEEHQAGNVYLDVNATGDWTIQIQELN